MIGYKAVPSGDVGTNAWSVGQDAVKAQKKKDAAVTGKALASGRYTFYQVRGVACVAADALGCKAVSDVMESISGC